MNNEIYDTTSNEEIMETQEMDTIDNARRVCDYTMENPGLGFIVSTALAAGGISGMYVFGRMMKRA